MTNPTDLLPRFAAASEWLAEHHPDAPRPDEWCESFDGYVLGGYVLGEGYGITYNPAACLCGAVVWAMEVFNWATRRYPEFSCHYMIEIYQDMTPNGFLFVLESICESLGRDG